VEAFVCSLIWECHREGLQCSNQERYSRDQPVCMCGGGDKYQVANEISCLHMDNAMDQRVDLSQSIA